MYFWKQNVSRKKNVTREDWHFEHNITFGITVLVQKMSNQQYEIMMCYII